MAAPRRRREDKAPESLRSVGGMFSAASFAGVVSKYGTGTTPEPDEPAPCPVVAFYGFRGGAGRTTALAHAAALLSARQVQVVAIDLDLEAPGLHQVLDCPPPEEDRGVLALLRAIATADPEGLPEALRLAPHVVKSGLDLGASIRVLPAGRLSERYLERLEDLGVPLWHISEAPSPLDVLLRRVKDELQPQAIFLDCRTGLSGLSASAVFHLADVVVCFLPVSIQSLEGLGVFLKGLKAAKLQRGGRPEALLVPGMVPDGPDGRARLEEWFLPEVEDLYAKIVLGLPETAEVGDEISDRIPVVREGIEYRRGIAMSDYLRSDFVQRSAGTYQALMKGLDPLTKVGSPTTGTTISAKQVLAELEKHANLRTIAFAESTDARVIVEKFIQPTDFKAIIDRSAWYVVGAKGAGKTWMWEYLLSDVGQTAIPDLSFIAGHGPRDAVLSVSAMREIERNRTARVDQRQLHGAFWLLYAVNRILQKRPALADPLATHFHADERRLINGLADAKSPRQVQDALTTALIQEGAGTFAEEAIRCLDAELLSSGSGAVVLLYDGLDIGFGSDERSIEMRARFVNALIEAIEPLRGACKRIGFKLFLREDIFS
ncbi:MAG TPA: hypothetical protein VMB50_04960, partial [Myxococcales bacterium]|nr:hypothetical protein [Myxococcales bacterium]